MLYILKALSYVKQARKAFSALLPSDKRMVKWDLVYIQDLKSFILEKKKRKESNQRKKSFILAAFAFS